MRKRTKRILLGLGTLVLLYALIPVPRLDDPKSTVLYARDGRMLGAKISEDEQWRFPLMDSVPSKFEQAILLFEDRYFYRHPGVNPISMARALVQNIRSGEIVSGGSTLTMQVIRIARKGRARTVWEKMIESVLATRLEFKKSKKDILNLYASHAPFGGNVVGLEAASWRYFGRSSDQLSWSESATLAVLPNAPSLIFPGKNQALLRAKRNRLLDKLFENGKMDELTLRLAKQETLPQKPHRLPRVAPHVLMNMVQTYPGTSVYSSLDFNLQRHCNAVVAQHQVRLQANEIHNMGLMVLDVKTGKVAAYVGNTAPKNNENHGNDVDVITAARSSGSILKPLLYAACLNDGEFLPNALIPDVPVYMDGFAPKNYNLTNEGAVPASQALSRSLNVPAVHMLKQYSIPKFHHLLKKLNFKSIRFSPAHYGLTLILGGAEVTLWDLCRVYRGMAKTLNDVTDCDDGIGADNYADPVFQSQGSDEHVSTLHTPFGAAAIYQTFMAMLEVNRPESEAGWEQFSSVARVAWKTGTSFGYRDAWAVGVTTNYVVGVWVGNADGEGRPTLTGATAAAPVMFEVFDYLGASKDFQKPYAALFQVPVCRESGYLASINCPNVDTLDVTKAGQHTQTCPYHLMVHLDASEQYRVNASCADPSTMIHKAWFVLPPAMAWYYQKKHPDYKGIPPMKPGCSEKSSKVLEMIYPEQHAQIYIPKELDGQQGKAVFEVLHQKQDAKIFWHLDNEFIQETVGHHQIALNPFPGDHLLMVMDEDGNSIVRRFSVVNSKK